MGWGVYMPSWRIAKFMMRWEVSDYRPVDADMVTGQYTC
jgi:hypothetical protein